MFPPRRVMAATDFSPGSRTAFAFAQRLATRCGAELHVVHAAEPSLVAVAARHDHDLRREVHDELRALVAAPAGRADDARLHVVVGAPAEVILDIAAREQADVVVLGANGLSSPRWPVLGATLEDVLRRSPVSVLVVPPSWPPLSLARADLKGIGPVIAGVAMTCPSIDAAVAGSRLAAALGTSLLLVHAIPPPQTAARWQPYADEAAVLELETSKTDCDRLTTVIQKRATVPVSMITECGDVATVLGNAARTHPHGIVVLGRGTSSHTYGGPGSLVERTVLMAHVPVLMHVDG